MHKKRNVFSVWVCLLLCIAQLASGVNVLADPEIDGSKEETKVEQQAIIDVETKEVQTKEVQDSVVGEGAREEQEPVTEEETTEEQQEVADEEQSKTDDEEAGGDPAFTGENPNALDEITGMDEEGNIHAVVHEDGRVSDDTLKTRSVEPKIVNFNIKPKSEVTNYTEAVTGIAGYTSGAYGADAAYLGEENGKIKFMLSGVIGLVSKADAQIVNRSAAKSLSFYEVSGGSLIHRITTNLTTTGYESNLNNGPAPAYLKAGVKYYSYDGHYFYSEDNFNNMLEDYKNSNRSHSVNASTPYYNYFQYLPIRSKTIYSGDNLTSLINAKTAENSKMKNMGKAFAEKQNLYGTNALLIASLAANESAWGMSNIAQTKNNLFGINAVDSSPGQSANTFPDTVTCVKDFTETMLSIQYMNPSNWKYYGGFLGNKASGMNLKYASDPYWGEKAASIAWSLDSNGGSKDARRYTIGIKDTLNSKHTNLNVRNGANTSSPSVHTTGLQSNHSFLILSQEGGFYKIQSDPVLNESRTKIAESGEYNYDKMYLYASTGYIDLISKGSGSPSDSLLQYNTHVSDIGWQGGFSEGAIAGTTGKAKKLEAITIQVSGINGLGISYRAHVSNIGWQNPVADGQTAGTTGKNLGIEAIQITLTGEQAKNYDIYYRTHVANLGWMDWAANGRSAGSAGYAYSMEAIQIELVKKGAPAPGGTGRPFVEKNPVTIPDVTYRTHISNIGWQNPVKNGAIAGSTGKALGMEALHVSVENVSGLNVNYKAHVRNLGWQSSVSNGAMTGTTGRNLPIEAIQISLSGAPSSQYDIYYRAHVANKGWMDWAKNGASAGSTGYAYALEAIQIQIVTKGTLAPGAVKTPCISR